METKVIDIRKEQRDKAKADAFENCRILYKDKNKPATESLMCFGWECPETWNEILRDLSYRLEALNLVYFPKFRTKIEAMQVKEKFGTLRFYYDVTTDIPFFVDCWRRLAVRISEFLNCGKAFKYQTVIDVPSHIVHEIVEIPEDEYNDVISSNKQPVNVEYHAEGGKFYEVTHLKQCQISHYAPTRHKFRYWLMKSVSHLSTILDFRHKWKYSPAQKVAAAVMSMEAEKAVNDAETATEHICCECGMEIGTDYNPTCVMTGWISYMCRHCAEKQTGLYTMNGKTYSQGKEVLK